MLLHAYGLQWRHNRYNHSEKVCDIVTITKMWCRDTKWANAIGKMIPIVVQYRVATNSIRKKGLITSGKTQVQ